MSTSVLFDKQKEKKLGQKLGLSDRLLDTNISIIKEMMYLAEDEKKKGRDIISLGVGIPYYKMFSYIRDHVHHELETNANIDKYTFFAGIPELRHQIATRDSKQLNVPINDEEILVTSGSMTALLYSALSIINPGDEVILLSPYFSSYAEQIIIAGGVPVEVALIEPKNVEDDYCIDIEKIKQAITKKTKAIIINSPLNPTGTVFSKKQLQDLADELVKHDIYVITDEVYDYLLYDEVDYFNIASIQKLWPKVIRCCSFSKKYAMTGWRVGYMHTNKDLLRHVLKLHDNTIVCAPHISQVAVMAAMKYENKKILDEHVALLAKNRKAICDRLDTLSDLFSYNRPKGAYYVFPKYKLSMPSTEFALKLLYEAGVVVTPGIGFGQCGENHVRMSFGGHYEEINRAFDNIDMWWENYKQKK